MAYFSSTSASSVANTPVLMFGVVGASQDTRITGSSALYLANNYNQSSTAVYREGAAMGGRHWAYYTTDVTTATLSTGYFTDAGALGMRPFDSIRIYGSGTTQSTAMVVRDCIVTAISTAGAAAITTGILLTPAST